MRCIAILSRPVLSEMRFLQFEFDFVVWDATAHLSINSGGFLLLKKKWRPTAVGAASRRCLKLSQKISQGSFLSALAHQTEDYERASGQGSQR